MSCRYASILLHFKTINMDKTNHKISRKLFEKPLYASVDTFMNGGLMIITSKLFYSYFGQIPNIYDVDKIDDKKLRYDVTISVFGKVIHQITREEFDAVTQLDTLNSHNFFFGIWYFDKCFK